MKQSFSFPDWIFPPLPTPVRGVPSAPLEKLEKIKDGYHKLVSQVSSGKEIDTLMDPEFESVQSSLVHRLSQNSHRQESLQPSKSKKINVDVMFKWAREAIDFADNQAGLSDDILSAARDIVILVAQSTPGLTKFKGAAQYILGVWYLFGLNGYPRDNKLALEHFYTAAQSDYPRALYRIGTEFEKSGDIANALQCFSQGMSKNDSACLYRLAMCHLRGHLGVEIDVDYGRSLLRKASETSDPDSSQASYMFGLIQLGELPSIAPPYPSLPASAGIQAIERAAWVGFGPALLRMGLAWQGGEMGYDSIIALRYFHIVSRQQQYLRWKGDLTAGLGGHAEAEISKWMLCGSVDMFPPNEEYSFYFAKLASEQKNGLAEFAVGYFYEVGIYVEKDIKAALIWYGIAASHDNQEAADRVNKLSLNRSNTITRQQHHRTLTIKGRGSIKSSLNKKATSNKQPESNTHYKQNSSFRDTSPINFDDSAYTSRQTETPILANPVPLDEPVADDSYPNEYTENFHQSQQSGDFRENKQTNNFYQNQNTSHRPNEQTDYFSNSISSSCHQFEQQPRRSKYSLPSDSYTACDAFVDDRHPYTNSDNVHCAATPNSQDLFQCSSPPYANQTPKFGDYTQSFSHSNDELATVSPPSSLQETETHSKSFSQSPSQHDRDFPKLRTKSRTFDNQTHGYDINSHATNNGTDKEYPYHDRRPFGRAQTFSENTIKSADSFRKPGADQKTNGYGESIEDLDLVLAAIDLNQNISQSAFGSKGSQGKESKKEPKQCKSSSVLVDGKENSQGLKMDGVGLGIRKENDTPLKKSLGALGSIFGLNGGSSPKSLSKDVRNGRFKEGAIKDSNDKNGTQKSGNLKNKGGLETNRDKDTEMYKHVVSSASKNSLQSLPTGQQHRSTGSPLTEFSHSLPPPRRSTLNKHENGGSSSSCASSPTMSSGGSPPSQPPQRTMSSFSGGIGNSGANHSDTSYKSQLEANRHRANSCATTLGPSLGEATPVLLYAKRDAVASNESVFESSSISTSFSSSSSPHTGPRRAVKHHPRNPNVVVIDALPSLGKGPKTFEDMEVPVVKSKEDCIMM